MGYFDRLRDLATAAASPAGREAPAVEPLEQEAVAVAPPPPVTTPRSPEDPPIVVKEARPRHERSDEGDVMAAPPLPPSPHSQRSREVPGEEGPHRATDPEERAVASGPPALEPETVPEPQEAEGTPALAPPRAEPPLPVAEEPPALEAAAPRHRPEPRLAASEGSADAWPEPDRRFHQALVRVRRWMAEPASSPADQADAHGEARFHGSPAPAASQEATLERRGSSRTETPSGAAPEAASAPGSHVVEERTEVSIGTISVTVEEPDAGSPTRPTGREPAAPSRGDGAVPRNYLRGW